MVVPPHKSKVAHSTLDLNTHIERLNEPTETVSFGMEVGTDREVFLSLEDLQNGHALVPGVTGAGKTFSFMLALIWQLILRGAFGFMFIDPVGTGFKRCKAFLGALYRTLTMMARTPYEAINAIRRQKRDALFSKIYILDFENPNMPYFFNPLELRGGLSAAEVTGDLLRVVDRLFGNINTTMRRQLVIRAAASLIAETREGTLLDLVLMLEKTDEEIRLFVQELVKRAQSRGEPVRLEFVRQYTEYFLTRTTGRERRELSQSTWNLMNSFGLSDDRVRRFFSAPRGNLPLEKIVQEGGYIFVHLPSTLDLNTHKVIGTLLINRIQTLCARRTPKQRENKFGLLVDECHLFFGEEWAELISTVRNFGLYIGALHQTDAQFLQQDGGDRLLQAFKSNIKNRFTFRLGEFDAEKSAYQIFRPEGLMIKLVEEETSETFTTAEAKTISEQITHTISHTLGKSKTSTITLSSGETLSYSENDGVSQTKTEGLTISRGRNWSQTESQGVTLTQSFSEGRGNSFGQGRSSSHSEGGNQSHTNGESYGVSGSSATFVSFNNGKTHSLIPMEALGGTLHQGRGYGSSQSRGFNDTLSHSSTSGSSWSKAIANITNHAQSLSQTQGVSRSFNQSSSKTVGASESESKSISESIAQIKSICKGLSQSKSLQRGISIAESETHTTGQSTATGESTQTSTAHARSKKTVTHRYSIDEEARVLSYRLTDLPKQHCYVQSRSQHGKAVLIRAHNLPTDFDTQIDGRDATEIVLEVTQPPPVQIPKDSVFTRLQRQRQRASFQPPSKKTGF